MKQVISLRDLEEMVRNGKEVTSLPPDALLTPSARDFIRDLSFSANGATANKTGSSASDAATAAKVTSQSSKGEIEAFFN